MIEQLTLDSAQGDSLKRQGQAAVAQSNQDFVMLVREQAKSLSLLHGSVTMDDLRLWAVGQGLYPTHQNAWGSVLSTRVAGWSIVGYQKSKIESSHSRMIAVWTYER